MENTKTTCENCKFFDLDTSEDAVDAKGRHRFGRCRRNPPKMPEKDLARSGWPRVVIEDWCGEFQAAGSGAEVYSLKNL